MYRILITWDKPINMFQELNGKVKVEAFNNSVTDKGVTILECRVDIKRGSRGFHNPGGYSAQVFEKFSPIINTMVESYFQGFLLSQEQFNWIAKPSDQHNDSNYLVVDLEK